MISLAYAAFMRRVGHVLDWDSLECPDAFYTDFERLDILLRPVYFSVFPDIRGFNHNQYVMWVSN